MNEREILAVDIRHSGEPCPTLYLRHGLDVE